MMKFIFLLQLLTTIVLIKADFLDEYEDTLELLPRKRQKDTLVPSEPLDIAKLCKQPIDLAIEEFKKNTSITETNKIDKQKASKFSADGVYSYYKSFVARFLQALEAPDHFEEHNLMVKIELTQKQLEKLKKFSEYSTKVDNSSIQDVTDILKLMIIGVENQNFESFLTEWLNNITEKFGINLYFTGIGIGFIMSYLLIVNFNLSQKIKWKVVISMILIFLFTYYTHQNYLYLKQQKELLKKAKLASNIPEECFPEQHEIKSNGDNFWTSLFTNPFKASPTSKICLEYAELLSFDQINGDQLVIEAIIYTLFKTIRPLVKETGNMINLFYVGLLDGLWFYEKPVVLLGIGLVLSVLATLGFLICYCNEATFFHLFTIKRKKENDIDLKAIKQNMIKELRAIVSEKFPQIKYESNTNTDSFDALKQDLTQACDQIHQLKITFSDTAINVRRVSTTGKDETPKIEWLNDSNNDLEAKDSGIIETCDAFSKDN